MAITKESLTAKLQEYEAEKAKLVANANAYSGAIELCKQLLEELEKENQNASSTGTETQSGS